MEGLQNNLQVDLDVETRNSEELKEGGSRSEADEFQQKSDKSKK